MINELNSYFEPLNNVFKGSTYSLKEYIGGELLPPDNIGNANCALIGISETRNAYEGKFNSSPDKIRAQLYKLTHNDLPKGIIDLGNLKPGKTVNDSYAAIKHITQVLIENNIIPVFFGGSGDIIYSITNALSENKDLVNTVIVDSHIDLGNEEELHSHSYIKKIKKSFPNTDFSILGYQSYFVTKSELSHIEDSGYHHVRLGDIRTSFNNIEPVLRDADLLSIDLNSVRYADCSATNYAGPNGLYADEICRLSFLSGLSDRLSVFHLAGYCSDKDKEEQTALLSAQTIWYFLFGVNQRKNDYPTRGIDSYNKIYVKIDKPDIEILFYKNEQNNRYWMELPVSSRKMIISCSESDYRAICNQNFPDRIWKRIQHIP